MSNIARQYIHVSYIDVFNIFFIVTTFTLNIFYIVYLDEQLPRHIALTVHQVAFNQEIHASFRFPCRSNRVCASFARRFPCNLKLGWKYDRYGIISFLSVFSSPSSKSDQAHGASHWGRRGAAGAPSTLPPGDWDGTTERNERGGNQHCTVSFTSSKQVNKLERGSIGRWVTALRVHLHQFNHLNPDRSGLKVGVETGSGCFYKSPWKPVILVLRALESSCCSSLQPLWPPPPFQPGLLKS